MWDSSVLSLWKYRRRLDSDSNRTYAFTKNDYVERTYDDFHYSEDFYVAHREKIVLRRQIYLVINQRFPGLGISALGKILFLRFFNPAIGKLLNHIS